MRQIKWTEHNSGEKEHFKRKTKCFANIRYTVYYTLLSLITKKIWEIPVPLLAIHISNTTMAYN